MSIKKRVCPKCRSAKVLKIIYGLMQKDAKIDFTKYYTGGCVVDEDINWHCNKCEHEW